MAPVLTTWLWKQQWLSVLCFDSFRWTQWYYVWQMIHWFFLLDYSHSTGMSCDIIPLNNTRHEEGSVGVTVLALSMPHRQTDKDIWGPVAGNLSSALNFSGQDQIIRCDMTGGSWYRRQLGVVPHRPAGIWRVSSSKLIKSSLPFSELCLLGHCPQHSDHYCRIRKKKKER